MPAPRAAIWWLALVAAVLAVCRAEAADHDELVIGVAQFPSGLHPGINPEAVKSYVIGFAQRPVTAFNQAWQNSCLVCAALPTLQNGLAVPERQPDGSNGLAVTFRLRPDLKWADGVPVTARDMAFAWRVSRDPKSGYASVATGRTIGVDVIDDHTAVVHLKEATVDYNQWDALLPEHLEGPVFAAAAAPGDYIDHTLYNRAPTTPGLWDGPYRISDYQSGVQIVLTPNPFWPGPAPGFRRIVIRHVEDTVALLANLLAGDIDMAAGEGIGLTLAQAIALRQQHPDQFSYIFKPSLSYEHIDLQLDNPILADVRVRQALLLAIDRKTLVDKLFDGLQPVADSFVSPLDPNYSDQIPHYPFDPARARALLAAAGWTPGEDGICRNAAGQRLSLEFATTAGNRQRELVQTVLQSQWKAAGIEVTIRNQPPRTLFGETLKQRRFTGMVMFTWASGVGTSPRQTLFSGDIPTAANNYGGSDDTGFSNPTMDADIARAETELDPARQKPIWAEMQRIYAEQLPVLPLFFGVEPHVVPKWLEGYAPTGTSDFGTLWAEHWRAR